MGSITNWASAIAAVVVAASAPAAAGPLGGATEIAPRSAPAAEIVRERREAAERRRMAIRPDTRSADRGDERLDEAFRMLEAAERVEGIKAARRGLEAAPDGDRIGRIDLAPKEADD